MPNNKRKSIDLLHAIICDLGYPKLLKDNRLVNEVRLEVYRPVERDDAIMACFIVQTTDQKEWKAEYAVRINQMEHEALARQMVMVDLGPRIDQWLVDMRILVAIRTWKPDG